MVENFFAVPIYFEKLNLNVEDIAEHCRGLKEKTPSNKKTNRGGWQSHNLEGEHKPLSSLGEAILGAAEKYRQAIHYKKPLKVANVWVNINGYKDYNTEHIHAKSFASGVFYVKVKSGDLVFIHPSHQSMVYDWDFSNFTEHTPYNNAGWNITPVENQLIIFPGWLAHRVDSNLSNEERITISFNLC